MNRVAVLDSLPLVDELFASLSGGEKFLKLNLLQVYHQIVLNKRSSELASVNTHCGLFQYKRLPSGVSSAVIIF